MHRLASGEHSWYFPVVHSQKQDFPDLQTQPACTVLCQAVAIRHVVVSSDGSVRSGTAAAHKVTCLKQR